MPLRRVRESILNRERVATGSYIQPAIVAFQGRKISRMQVEWLDPVATRSRFCIERSFGKGALNSGLAATAPVPIIKKSLDSIFRFIHIAFIKNKIELCAQGSN
jgi:hypothetical protein